MQSLTLPTRALTSLVVLFAADLTCPADESPTPPSAVVRIAAVQVSGYDKCDVPREGFDPTAKLTPYIDRAGADDADLVVFPEYVLGRIRVPGPETDKIAAAAAANQTYVIVGCWEVFEDDTYANTALIFDRRGKISGKYRKTHAAVDHYEGEPAWSQAPTGRDRDWFLRNDPEWTMQRGDRLPVFDFDFGRVGVLTCYDGWFPESFRALSLQGAELIVWINGRGGSVEDFIVKSVMFQSHVAVVSTNQAYGGGTMIGDVPTRILARCPDREESCITADVDFSNIRKTRRFSRNFQQRRPDIYGPLTTLSADGIPRAAGTESPAAQPADRPADKLRVATCQFPVSADIAANGRWIRKFMHQAAEAGAHLLHTSETSLSGYARADFANFEDFDWDLLRTETAEIRRLAEELELWVVLGSAHYLDGVTKPTNCLYLIDPQGRIVDRYDKAMCTYGDQEHYSAGNRLVTHEIQGVKVGLAICYDVCWPQIYAAYHELGATVILHSFYNARSNDKSCLDVLVERQVPTRCADNRMWAVANNSSASHSNWASFVARPDSTIAQQLSQNEPGMLVHDFPDGLSKRGWLHNHRPMRVRDDEPLTFGTSSSHPRQAIGTSEP